MSERIEEMLDYVRMNNCISLYQLKYTNKILEHVTNLYASFIVIGQFACFAHQNRGFWWAKQAH